MFGKKKRQIEELTVKINELKMTNNLLIDENQKLFKDNRELKHKLKIHEIQARNWTGVTYSLISRCIMREGGEIIASDIGPEAAKQLIDLLWKVNNLKEELYKAT